MPEGGSEIPLRILYLGESLRHQWTPNVRLNSEVGTPEGKNSFSSWRLKDLTERSLVGALSFFSTQKPYIWY